MYSLTKKMNMKRACFLNINKHEDLSCEFHPTSKNNYLRMKSKLIITFFMLCVLNIAAFCQLDTFTTYQEIDSLARQCYKNNNLDSVILLNEYARSKFPEHDEEATYTLDYLFFRTKQDSLTIENWDYGLKKGISLDYRLIGIPSVLKIIQNITGS